MRRSFIKSTSRSVRSLFCLMIIIPLFLGFTTSCSEAAKLVALVIGNSAYENSANLPNPVNDADGIEQTLMEMGYEVVKVKNIGYNKMRLALRLFSRKAENADIALIFYAGHGMEVDKHNYLIPVDATLKSDRDIEFEAIPLDLLTQAASGAKELSLVLLDACRNNPFAASMKRTLSTRSIGRGLALVEPAAGTLVSFAAREGTIANDGDGRNSPYTTALMKHLQEPGLDVQFLFRKVRDAVLQETGGSQEPFTYGSLPARKIFLVAPDKRIEKTGDQNNTEQAQLQRPSEAQLVYREIKNSDIIAVLEEYISSFPDSFYAKLALLRIRELKKQQAREEQSRQQKIAQAKENLRQEKLRNANREWNSLKFSEDESALNQFRREYADTHYAVNADRRIKYLKSLRNQVEIDNEEKLANTRKQSENSKISADPFLISKHRTWRAYRFKNSTKDATCYVAATPVKIAPTNRAHGDIFFMLTKYATDRSFEPHFTVGFPFKTSSSVKVKVGKKFFNMFTKSNDAWVDKVSNEAALLSAMKSAANMELTGFTSRGIAVKYHFSLSGVTAALKALRNCS